MDRIEAIRRARRLVRDAEREWDRVYPEGTTDGVRNPYSEVDWELDLLQSELQRSAMRPSPSKVITAHFCNVSNLPESLQVAALGRDLTGIGEGAVEALNAAGYKIVGGW